MKTLSVQDLHEQISAGLKKGELLLDVRTLQEFQAEHIEGSLHIPLSQLPFSLDELEGFQTIYLLCRSGGRSAQALDFLSRNLDVDLFNVEGGILAWRRAAYPVN